MPVDVLTGFVDRGPELDLFHRMLAGETDKRVLLILERGEQGKTCFLLRLVHECEDQGVPVAHLDFDQRRSGLTDYLSVARELRRHLGDACTSAICQCHDEITRLSVNVHTGAGDAGVDFGTDSDFTGAATSRIAGRDLIQVTAGPPTPAQIARWPDDMGRALRDDLANLDLVVLLIDTFEHTPKDTCTWLERWLFEPLRSELPHVILVVAGRPECRDFFARPRLWGHLIDVIERFTPLSDDDIQAHYRQRGLSVSSVEVSLIAIARTSPGRMAQVGDWLEQTRGGVR